MLANHAAPGTSMREAWRQMTVGTIEPLAGIISDQLTEALGEGGSHSRCRGPRTWRPWLAPCSRSRAPVWARQKQTTRSAILRRIVKAARSGALHF